MSFIRLLLIFKTYLEIQNTKKELKTLSIVESLQIKNSKFYINVELFARLKKGLKYIQTVTPKKDQ